MRGLNGSGPSYGNGALAAFVRTAGATRTTRTTRTTEATQADAEPAADTRDSQTGTSQARDSRTRTPGGALGGALDRVRARRGGTSSRLGGKSSRSGGEVSVWADRATQRTFAFWLFAALTTLGTLAAISACVLAHHLVARTDREITRFSQIGLGPPVSRRPLVLNDESLVLVLDARGRVIEKYAGSDGLPSFPALAPARLKTYAAASEPTEFGGDYRAKVVRTPRAGLSQDGSYVVTAQSTAGIRQSVVHLLQVEALAALPLLLMVLLGARSLARREARERRETERRLREFLAAAGHELRNPLTTISGYAELARVGDPSFEPMRQEALGRVATEIDRMTTLIDELFLLTRLDLGQPLQLRCVDLARLCRDAASAARDCHPDHPVRLLLAPGDHTVTGDPLRLHQLVANLLTNARVHTPEGTTTTLGLGTEDGHRVIEVMDDGPGIPRELRERIFDRFVRGEETTAAGSGLGLSIVAAIAQAHGGTVVLEPSRQGTWFRVLLPAPG